MLERCFQALWLQTRRPDRVVVVDNGDDELTRLIASRWDAVFLRERQPGIPAASAAGYDVVEGDLIARLDADSVPPRRWVETVLAAFAAHPELDAITGPGDFVELPRPARMLADRLYMDAYFRLFGAVAGHPPLFGSNFAMRIQLWRECRDRVHRMDAGVHDDLDLSLCAPVGSRIRRDPALRVEVSARPFADPVAFLRRIRRGLHTVVVNRRALLSRSRSPRHLTSCSAFCRPSDDGAGGA